MRLFASALSWITPSLTVSRSAATPRLVAAMSIMSRRASAAISRKFMPPREMPVAALAPPMLTVRPVSPMTSCVGLIVNPDTLRHVIDRQLVYGTSRTMFEELRFDANMVTSIDWETYPVLHADFQLP